MRHIVCLSGGLASAWVAKWAVDSGLNPILYFNDTKWEHKDLYRFLDDIEKKLETPILRDSDGRSPEEVFYKESMLGNNRFPLCSKILKAKRLQKFIQPGDVVYFGIDKTEAHRAVRIKAIYDEMQVSSRFPLIENDVSKDEVRSTIQGMGIAVPAMYAMGFKHNNCSGGCVRAGKGSWSLLYRTMPDVYAERERVETEFGEYIGKPVSYMKDMTLRQLREKLEEQPLFQFDDDDKSAVECVGICSTEN